MYISAKVGTGFIMKHLCVVLTEPTEGKAAEFDDYYENTHLDEVLATTGWETAQRFRLTDQIGQKCPLSFLALYEVEAEDPKVVIKKMNDTRAQRQQSDSLNRTTAAVWVFSETGPQHRRDPQAD
jgi:hypothetical protein